MKKSTRLVRDAGAMLAVVALVSMIFLQFWFERLTVSQQAYTTLILLISTLLGLDMVRERRELILAIAIGALDGYKQHVEESGSDNNDN